MTKLNMVEPSSIQNRKPSMKYIFRPMGLIEVSGGSRLDLINRMSTNQVALLKPGGGAATVLTTDVGRIIDRVILYAGESTALMMTGENNGDNIGRYLMRFVFFNDDFRLQPLDDQFVTLFVYGGDAAAKIGEICGVELDLPLHSWVSAQIAGADVSIHSTDPLQGGGWMLKIPAGSEPAVQQALEAAGGETITEEQFDAMRIEEKLPKLRHELTKDFIPLETGLWDDISFNKGCYTGQEIIARMESREKIYKELMRFEIQNGGPIPAGTEIRANGTNAGTITTSVGNRALGYVKSAVLKKQIDLIANGSTISPDFEPQSN
ncbi:MAG: hypothetical protein AAGD96_35125 [Chloroflexota bacterium]